MVDEAPPRRARVQHCRGNALIAVSRRCGSKSRDLGSRTVSQPTIVDRDADRGPAVGSRPAAEVLRRRRPARPVRAEKLGPKWPIEKWVDAARLETPHRAKSVVTSASGNLPVDARRSGTHTPPAESRRGRAVRAEARPPNPRVDDTLKATRSPRRRARRMSERTLVKVDTSNEPDSAPRPGPLKAPFGTRRRATTAIGR